MYLYLVDHWPLGRETPNLLSLLADREYVMVMGAEIDDAVVGRRVPGNAAACAPGKNQRGVVFPEGLGNLKKDGIERQVGAAIGRWAFAALPVRSLVRHIDY